MNPLGNSAQTKSYKLFGTDGIRGEAKTVLNPDFVLQIGYMCGLILSERGPFIIGQDSRESGEIITSSLSAGLTAAGKEVWQLGICPTPAIPHLIKKYGASGGIMVSASHNPPEDNGVKLFNSTGNKISPTQQSRIEKGLRNSGFKPSQIGHKIERPELLNDYKTSLLESIAGKSLDGLTVVLDLCWGSATSCGEEIFQATGANVITINSEPIGSKINVNCGSTNLKPLQKAVLEHQADMGFAFDGDADRMIAVDEEGEIIDGDHVLYLWGSFLKAQNELHENRLIATTMSNLGLEKAWLARGGVLERTGVGDQKVQEAMLSFNANLGGEQSGHILSSINGLCGDGILSAIQLATISTELKISFSEWLSQSFTPYPQKLINIPIKSKNIKSNWKESEPFQEAIQQAQALVGEDGRILIRASGTQPLLRIMVESEDPKIVESLTSKLAEVAYNNINAA